MIQSIFFVLLALSASAFAQWNSFCGGAGYDVSSLIGKELTLTTNYVWVLAPCGTIRNTTDTFCANDPEAVALGGSMFCQRDSTGLSVYTLANWNESVAQSAAQWVALSNGVSVRVQVGERCPVIGNTWREVTIEFRCNMSTPISQPWFQSISEPETCWYVAVIHTPSACTPVGPTMSNQIGSSFYSHQCGGGVFDLSSLGTKDLTYDSPRFLYWMRVCAFVNETRCASAQPSSFCQLGKSSTDTPVDVSDFNASVANLYTVTPVGLNIDLKSGESCQNMGLRQTTYHLVCNPKARSPIVSDVYEAPVCWYHAIIQTSAVCTGSNNPAQGWCGGAGYDLTPIAGYDLSVQQASGNTVYNWYLHPCGPLSTWFTLACQGSNTMFCQESNSTRTAYSLATWNGSIAETATWMAITNGVQLYVQTGMLCAAASNLPRDTAIQFICDRTAFAPRFHSVTEQETCYYVAIVYTEAACDTVGPTAPHVPGSTFQDQTCGGQYLDLSDIRDEVGDLTWDSNPTANDSYVWYLELCGTVSNPRCNSVQPSMFCQAGRGAWTGVYSIAGWAENQLVTYTINDNGLTMQVQSGTECGGIPRRAVTINIICDGTTPAAITSIREIEVCHYTAIIHGRCSYGSTEPWSTGGPRPANPSSVSVSITSGTATSSISGTTARDSSTGSNTATGSTAVAVAPDSSSSSSSLSGGAIAGIVIGSIVGGLLLLLLIFVFCCGGAVGRSKTKFNEMPDDRMEESRTSQSGHETGEVEMETA